MPDDLGFSNDTAPRIERDTPSAASHHNVAERSRQIRDAAEARRQRAAMQPPKREEPADAQDDEPDAPTPPPIARAEAPPAPRQHKAARVKPEPDTEDLVIGIPALAQILDWPSVQLAAAFFKSAAYADLRALGKRQKTSTGMQTAWNRAELAEWIVANEERIAHYEQQNSVAHTSKRSKTSQRTVGVVAKPSKNIPKVFQAAPPVKASENPATASVEHGSTVIVIDDPAPLKAPAAAAPALDIESYERSLSEANARADVANKRAEQLEQNNKQVLPLQNQVVLASLELKELKDENARSQARIAKLESQLEHASDSALPIVIEGRNGVCVTIPVTAPNAQSLVIAALNGEAR